MTKIFNDSEITKLSNGITIVSEFVPYVESFSIGYFFNNGTRDENKSNNGISHFLEHMFFKGTRKRSARRISDMIESYGGEINAFTSKEHTCIYSRGLSENFKRTFDVMADMVQNPRFRDSDIQREKGVVIDELRDLLDTPDELIFDKYEETLFRGSPLELPVLGSLENIRKFDSERLDKYFHAKYNTRHMTIAVSGNIEHQKAVELAQKYFGDRKRKKSVRKITGIRSVPQQETIVKEVEQVYYILGREGYGYNDDNKYVLNLLSNIIGEGGSSRLYQSVRERLGISYQILSFLSSYHDVSAFGIYFSTSAGYVDKVLKIISREFNKIRNKPVSNKELKRAKEYLKGNILLGLESTVARMFRLAHNVLNYGEVVPVKNIIEKVDSVSIDQVTELAQDILREDKLTSVKIVPKNKLITTAA